MSTKAQDVPMVGKHTPGPWQLYADTPSTDPNWHIVTNLSRLRVLANVHIEPGNAVDAANALLIKAAPDLYEACLIIQKGFYKDSSTGKRGLVLTGAELDRVDAALLKATPVPPAVDSDAVTHSCDVCDWKGDESYAQSHTERTGHKTSEIEGDAS